MKKIAAFFTALVLFMAVITGIHFTFDGSLKTNNPEFGTWINPYKDLSYTAVSQNTSDKTVLLMGSSEFQYGRKTKYHPTRIFRDGHIDLMCVGAAYNQSLSHAITLAADAPALKSKKAVLMLSPSWFNSTGVKPQAFSVRFSESEYMAMLNNPQLSNALKEKISKRSLQLLSADDSMAQRVKKYDRLFLYKNGTVTDRAFYNIRKSFLKEKENITVNLSWRINGEKNLKKYSWTGKALPEPDWDDLYRSGEEDAMKKCSNQFYMSDKFFSTKIEPRMHKKKDSDFGKTYAKSPEYDDLKLFLEVCKEENIDVKLILLPLNGYWYDYTGFPKDGRQAFVTNVEKIATQYGVETCNLFTECYNKYFMADALHPSGKGWSRINEAIYDFVK